MSLGDTLHNTIIDGGADYQRIATPNPMESVYKLLDSGGTDHKITVSQSSSKKRARSVFRVDWKDAADANGIRETYSVYVVSDAPVDPTVDIVERLEFMFRSDLLNVFSSGNTQKVFGRQV